MALGGERHAGYFLRPPALSELSNRSEPMSTDRHNNVRELPQFARYPSLVRRRIWMAILISVAALVLGLALTRQSGRPGTSTTHGAIDSRARSLGRLDLPSYRAQQARLREGARRIAERLARPVKAHDERANAVRSAARVTFSVFDPCEFGADVCASVYAIADDCMDGDADTCLALAQFLSENPPRPMIAVSFFYAACRGGSAEACARLEQTSGPMTKPCAEDPFVCAFAATRTADVAVLDEACTLGVADACSALTILDKDPSNARSYLERSCQLGSALACLELAKRLSTECRPAPRRECYAPDALQAAAALEIGCTATPNREECTR